MYFVNDSNPLIFQPNNLE